MFKTNRFLIKPAKLPKLAYAKKAASDGKEENTINIDTSEEEDNLSAEEYNLNAEEYNLNAEEDDLSAEEDQEKNNKRKQRFRSAWTEKFLWVEKITQSNGNERPFCSLCKKILTNNITNLRRHEESDYHKKAVSALKKQPQLFDTSFAEFNKKNNKVKSAEIKITMFFLENNLPFSLVTPFTNLVKSIAPDSQILKDVKFGKTKMTETTNNLIFEEGEEMIASVLRKQKFSIIVDETTDVSTSKCLVIVVRYYDFLLRKVQDRFFSLLELKNCDSKSIFEAIIGVIKKNEIPITNLIGFASDNASVMVGKNSGVTTLLKELQSYLFCIGCTCHSIHLCSAAASKKIPESVEVLARNIYVFFSHSSKRLNELKEFQTYFNVKAHKILKRSATRWLSLEMVVSRILEQWVPLKHYFITYQLVNNADLAHSIYREMTDETKIYFYFLLYILKLTNKINLEYQAEEPRLPFLLETVKMYFKTILSNFLKPVFIKDDNIDDIDFSNKNNSFLNTEDIYIGAQATLYIENNQIDLQKVKEIKSVCLSYYIELCQQILYRINFRDPVLQSMEILNPKTEIRSLTPMMRLFPNLVNESVEELDEEWRT